MGKKVTLGGERVGSGKKMQAELHNYFRSTHNLSEKWRSTMGAGILYPALCKVGMRGDAFDIKIDLDARTIPTLGPLFGSFKMQVDIYQVPIRLYQGILHNNPLAIGLNMAQVKFPMLKLKARQGGRTGSAWEKIKNAEMNNSSLLKYLGLSGIGVKSGSTTQAGYVQRYINALPALSYYDIFKTYYANKQEPKAYVITGEEKSETLTFNNLMATKIGKTEFEPIDFSENYGAESYWQIKFSANKKGLIENDPTILTFSDLDEQSDADIQYSDVNTGNHVAFDGIIVYSVSEEMIDAENVEIIIKWSFHGSASSNIIFSIEQSSDTYNAVNKLKLQPFDLSNIDDMRYDLLSSNRLGSVFVIDEDNHNYLPYSTLIAEGENTYVSFNTLPLNGLVLKTYQNDIFNNWLNAEWIEGENGINELSKVSIVDGAFSMDALNFTMKLYNMLNRIAVAGATYEDWQDVVYEEVKRRQIESPIFIGGVSKELVFDEIVQTSGSNGDPEDTLGTLGGRGRLSREQKGGKVHIKCDEACFIMAIASLTPRISYTQGNEFYMTELQSMDDLHKPAMDGIGFQNLLGERLAWWDTVLTTSEGGTVVTINHRSKVGKLPAWIEYMTSYDRAFGDFAGTDGKGYMVLNRNYEFDEQSEGEIAPSIKDVTTYIDPSKYNYIFAYNELEAQNFWVQINFDIKARRLMSARLIPNV